MDQTAKLAWAAGMIDGEGYIGVSGRGSRHQVRLTVNSCDPRGTDEFISLFGGHVTTVDASKYNPRARTRFCWELRGKTAAACLSRLLPYLVMKRDQAELLIEYAGTLRKGAVKSDDVWALRDAINDKLRALKTTVWVPPKAE